MDISLQRIYDAAHVDIKDDYRVLVDRLWPRGVSKEQAQIDYWAKEIAPSSELRTWFGHKPERFEAFSAQYISELNDNPNVSDFMQKLQKHPNVVFLYGAKDPKINHAVVLKQYVAEKLRDR